MGAPLLALAKSILDNLFTFLVFHLSVVELGLGCEGEN